MLDKDFLYLRIINAVELRSLYIKLRNCINAIESGIFILNL